MKLKSLLVAAAVTAAVADGAAFQWEPVISQPNPSFDVTAAFQLETLRLYCYGVEGVAMTDVMPVWIDEDGYEVKAVSGSPDPWGWNPNEFNYEFNISDFKGNGEYILLFPEGMLTNAAGELSDKVETPFTLEVPELAGGMFDDFRIESITPDFSEPQAIWIEQIVTINTNHNDAIGLTKLQVTDKTMNESVLISSNFTTARAIGDSSPISWEVAGTFRFFEGHDYVAEFVFYNGSDEYNEIGEQTPVVDRISYEFTGKVEGFKYSTVTLESVEPSPFTILANPEDAIFTYTFTGPVTVYNAVTPLGSAGINTYPPSCLSSNADKTVWTLNLSENSFILSQDASVIINIQARDEEGNQLRGNEGEEGEACYQYEWECEFAAVPIVAVNPEQDGVIERLCEITVKSSNGEPMEWSWLKQAYVLSTGRAGILGYLEYELDFEADPSDVVTFTKWRTPAGEIQPIDLAADGYYRIVFEHGCFNFGEQFDSKQSHSLTVAFEISNGEQPGDENDIFFYDSVDPAVGSTLSSLSEIKIHYPEEIGLVGYDAQVMRINDEGESEFVCIATLDYDWEDWNVVNLYLSQPITEAGNYTILVPKGFIGTPEYCESDGTKGICNPEFTLEYQVGTGNAVAALETASVCDVFDMQGRVVLRGASNADVKKLAKGVYVVNGKKVVVK